MYVLVLIVSARTRTHILPPEESHTSGGQASSESEYPRKGRQGTTLALEERRCGLTRASLSSHNNVLPICPRAVVFHEAPKGVVAEEAVECRLPEVHFDPGAHSARSDVLLTLL